MSGFFGYILKRSVTYAFNILEARIEPLLTKVQHFRTKIFCTTQPIGFNCQGTIQALPISF